MLTWLNQTKLQNFPKDTNDILFNEEDEDTKRKVRGTMNGDQVNAVFFNM